jgi:hypothetical protein
VTRFWRQKRGAAVARPSQSQKSLKQKLTAEADKLPLLAVDQRDNKEKSYPKTVRDHFNRRTRGQTGPRKSRIGLAAEPTTNELAGVSLETMATDGDDGEFRDCLKRLSSA